MKVRLLSDLHTEGCKFDYVYLGEDVLVLAGDVVSGKTLSGIIDIMDRVPMHVPVLFVMGNHESYGNDFNIVCSYFQNIDNTHYTNFHFLDKTHINIGDISFFGGTMFTDFGLNGLGEQWFAEMDAKRNISDFFTIAIDDRQWTTVDHKIEYELFNREFDRWVKDAEGKKRVCISHFVPTPNCIDPRFKGSNLNPYFIANQDDRIQLVDTWFFGHTHTSYDIMLGDTRLVCNPRGYGCGKENLNFNPNLILEI